MLTHQDEGTEKCPVVNCEYHGGGFAHRTDLKRHLLTHHKGTMICFFCPLQDSWAEKIFSQVDDFKRHLTSVHGVQQHSSDYGKRGQATSTERGSPRCSICSDSFDNAQDFYDHLDECVLFAIYEDIEIKRLRDDPSLGNMRDPIANHELLETAELEDRDERIDNWKHGSDSSRPKSTMAQEGKRRMALAMDSMASIINSESTAGKSMKFSVGDQGRLQIDITGGNTSRPPADNSDGDIRRSLPGDDTKTSSGKAIHSEPFKRWPDIPSNIGNHLPATNVPEVRRMLPFHEPQPVYPVADSSSVRKSDKTVGIAQGDISPWHAFETDRDRILDQIDERLSSSASDFVQKNHHADSEEGRRRIAQSSSSMKWSEWVWHLDKLLTEHHIPRKAVSNGTPKRLILVLWESLNMHIATTYNSQPEEAGRNLLRLISVGTQVVKFFNDMDAVQFFDTLYLGTERLIIDRRWDPTSTPSAPTASAPTAPPKAQPTKTAYNIDVATDSGYGSYAERKYVQSSLSLQLERETSPASRNVDSAFTRESGYAEGRESRIVDIDESASVYSTTSFLADSTRDAYVSAIAELMCSSVYGPLGDSDVPYDIISKVYESLPRLLKSFSLSIGNNTSSKMHLDAMFFIRRYRK